MIERQFLRMMPHTIQRAPETGRTFKNVKSYGDDESFRCRITGKVLALRRNISEEDTVIFDIYICPYPVVDGVIQWSAPVAIFRVTDRITLPDDQAFIDQTPVVFAVGRLTDEKGHHHVKLQCGWMYHRQGQ